MLEETPYELWRNWKSNICCFHTFNCVSVSFIHNIEDQIENFDSKVDKVIFFWLF